MACLGLEINWGQLEDRIITTILNVGARHVQYLICVDGTVRSVSTEMKDLANHCDDVRRRVEVEEKEKQWQRTSTVNGWLESVNALRVKVAAVQADFHNLVAVAFPNNCSLEHVLSRYNLGWRASEALSKIRSLKANRPCGEFTQPPPAEQIVVVPTVDTVGSEFVKALDRLRSFLEDDKVSIIGIYGAGGTGKTTLMAKLNNELASMEATWGFTLAAFVTVSNRTRLDTESGVDPVVDKLQMDIGQRFKIPMTDEEGRKSRASKISTSYGGERFVLFLDDVWRPVDLAAVGIPRPDEQNRCKVILTTRFQSVCDRMGASGFVEVRCLGDDDAWELFRRNAWRALDRPQQEIVTIARNIAKECGGLPLALIVVGRALASKMSVEEWRFAERELKKRPEDFEDLRERLLSHLKLSYDYLPDDTLRKCFLYCSLFPEDYNIKKEQLVQYWIGEGLVGEEYQSTPTEARDRGHYLVGVLKNACLLQDGADPNKDVTMHDMIRDLALWIASTACERAKGRFLVDADLSRSELATSWSAAERVSLINNRRLRLPHKADCPMLVTLLLRENVLIDEFPSGFFSYMPLLCTLDLSFARIDQIPGDIGLLAELRYLNLSFTPIRSLPPEIGQLSKLRRLDLSDTKNLQIIPARAVSRLSSLRSLDMYASCYGNWTLGSGANGSGVDLTGEKPLGLDDLERLEELNEIGLTVSKASSLQLLLRVGKWLMLTRRLHLEGSWQLEPDKGVENHQELHELIFYGEDGRRSIMETLNLVGLFGLRSIVLKGGTPHGGLHNLRILEISCNLQLRSLTWIRKLPFLEEVFLHRCVGIEELVEDGDGESEVGEEDGISFPNLKYMSLDRLRSLRSIYNHPLGLPSLKYLLVFGCEKLRRLPLGIHSAKNLQVIRGPQRWWEQLEWEAEQVGLTFNKNFIPWEQGYQSRGSLWPESGDMTRVWGHRKN